MGPHIIPKSANNRLGFPKQARLLRSVEFRNVYDHGRRKSLDFLLAFALKNGKPVSRIGLTVSRAVGGSVERNLIKRRLREAMRKHLADLGPGWDIVFNARQSAKQVKFAALEETVRNFFQSLCTERGAGGSTTNPS